jgi:PST family polysaccharide transporter
LWITLNQFDDFWAGTALGAAPLGYYSRAYEIAGYPARVLATPVTHVFYSTFSALQDDEPELSRAVAFSNSFLVRVGFLLAVLLLTVIPEATRILLGESWLPIVPVLRLMTVYVVLDPLYVNLSYLTIGLGRPEVLVRVRLGQVALFVMAVVALAYGWGIEGIAVAADLMMLAGVAALFVQSARHVRLELAEVLGWPILALLAASAAGVALSSIKTWPGLWVALIAKGLAVVLAFAVVLFVAERRALLRYGKWMSQLLGSLRSTGAPPSGPWDIGERS